MMLSTWLIAAMDEQAVRADFASPDPEGNEIWESCAAATWKGVGPTLVIGRRRGFNPAFLILGAFLTASKRAQGPMAWIEDTPI